MKINIHAVLPALAVLIIFQACNNTKKDKKNVPTDGYTFGTATFVADESFSPIVDEEAFVFKALYPEAKPVFDYQPESQVINALVNDKSRVAIIARELDSTETGILERRALTPDVNKFAIDAVTLIVNKASNDTLTSVQELVSMLNGQAKTNKSIVFDNPNSSLVRYLKQISGNKDFKQKNIYALKSNKEVIKYVASHPDALGITGFSWLNDPDKDYADAVNAVKIVGVKDAYNKKAPNVYFKPSQETLVQHTYPLSRSLYIIDCTGRKGLGAGFASFLASERGQRIILKSGLLPDSIPSREINITH